MNSAARLCVLILAGVMAAALASSGQSSSTEMPNAASGQAKGTIIFYRPGAFYGKALKPSIYVDGSEIGRLKSGKYISYETTAGKHSLSSSKKESGIEVEVSSEQPQYVEMLIQNGTWRGAGRLIAVPADEGKRKADQLKLQED